MSKIEKNWLEWCVFAASSLLVIAVLGYVAREALEGKQEPPLLEVQLGPAQPRGGDFTVPVTVYNRGDRTAEAVQVLVVLTQHDGRQEQATFELQFMPPQARRRGFVAFQSDPATAASVEARTHGYAVP